MKGDKDMSIDITKETIRYAEENGIEVRKCD